MTPVAHHVDGYVPPEFLSEAQGELGRVDDRLGVIAVDVKDRSLDHFHDVGRVAGRAGLSRGSREPNLIVHHEVDRSAGPIALEL